MVEKPNTEKPIVVEKLASMSRAIINATIGITAKVLRSVSPLNPEWTGHIGAGIAATATLVSLNTPGTSPVIQLLSTAAGIGFVGARVIGAHNINSEK